MAIRPFIPTEEHQQLMRDLKQALAKHPNLHPAEMLALAAQLVGNLIALQDQRVMTAEEALELVSRNIEHGNEFAIAQVLGKTAGNA